jgi:hypothetical protein
MATTIVTQTETDAIPHRVEFSTLPTGTLYTFSNGCLEQDKAKGSEDAEELAQAIEQGSVYVWLSVAEWERATAPQAPAAVSPRTARRSALFTVYNRARASGLDKSRVNRALGIVQAGRVQLLSDGSAAVTNEDGITYLVKGKSCTCADHQYRRATCKHIVAAWLLLRMGQALPFSARVALQAAA